MVVELTLNPRRAEQGIEDHRHERGIQADGHRQPGHRRIGHRLGYDDGRRRETGDPVEAPGPADRTGCAFRSIWLHHRSPAALPRPVSMQTALWLVKCQPLPRPAKRTHRIALTSQDYGSSNVLNTASSAPGSSSSSRVNTLLSWMIRAMHPVQPV